MAARPMRRESPATNIAQRTFEFLGIVSLTP
jgi:hypothetical protein